MTVDDYVVFYDYFIFYFFFFKQKTAYEMRISDWSSDVCSSDLLSSANAYTDAKFAAWDDTFAAFQGEIDHRLAEQDRRIDKQGAMGAAMLNMATSAAGIRTQNRVGV